MSMGSLEGVIATSRFGLGAKPGEIEAASSSPREWLKAQINRNGAEQPTDALPSSADHFAQFAGYLRQVGILKKDGTISDQPTPGPNGTMTEERGAAIQEQRKELLKPVLDGVRDEIFARTK